MCIVAKASLHHSLQLAGGDEIPQADLEVCGPDTVLSDPRNPRPQGMVKARGLCESERSFQERSIEHTLHHRARLKFLHSVVLEV